MTNAYAVLYVEPTSTDKEIKAAYRLLCKTFHPDTNPATEALFCKVQSAYELISTPQKRAEYDQKQNPNRSKPKPKAYYGDHSQATLTAEYPNYSVGNYDGIGGFVAGYHKASGGSFSSSIQYKPTRRGYGNISLEIKGGRDFLEAMRKDLNAYVKELIRR